ncbi:MAG: hypothetical protein AB1772_01060 [Candidatus Zixiibacteriota bacterium]
MTVLALVIATTLTVVSVPDGGCVLVNGFLGDGEWDSSASARLDADTEIRVHKDGSGLFLAIAFQGPRHTGVDLYLRSHERTRMLHVSSALGEKVLDEGRWAEMSWGRNSWWSANVVGTIVEGDRQRFLEPEAFEFQLDRRELGADVYLFVHLKRPEKSLPLGVSQEAPEKWMRLRLE